MWEWTLGWGKSGGFFLSNGLAIEIGYYSIQKVTHQNVWLFEDSWQPQHVKFTDMRMHSSLAATKNSQQRDAQSKIHWNRLLAVCISTILVRVTWTKPKGIRQTLTMSICLPVSFIRKCEKFLKVFSRRVSSKTRYKHGSLELYHFIGIRYDA